MATLNKMYFFVFVIIISVSQYLLYDKILLMDKTNKGIEYLTDISKKSITKTGNTLSIEKLKKDSKGLIFDNFNIKITQNEDFKFLYDYKIINKDKKLNINSSEDKNIYDSCKKSNKIIKNVNNSYLISNIKDSTCNVLKSKKLLLRNPHLGPLFYFFIALILIIISLFVYPPIIPKNRLILSVLLLLYQITFFTINILDVKDREFKFGEIENKINLFSKVSYQNLVISFSFILIMTLLFLYFFNSKLNKKLSNTLVKHKTPYLYIFPGVSGIIILLLIPLFSGIVLSFFKVRYNQYTFSWLSNYSDILIGGLKDISNPEGFYYTFLITVIWTALNIFFHLFVGMSLALIINKKGLKFKKIYSIIFIIPWAIPNYITALIWKSMFHKQFGAINNFIALLGFEKISWFSETFSAFMANLLTNIWLGFPFMMVMTLGALQSIPTHLYDAAVMDGASRWQQFKYVTIPMLKPALLPSIILGIIWTFNMFNVIYLVSGGEPNSSTDILITEAYRWAFERNGRYGYSAAYATIIFLVLFLYNHAMNKISNKVKNS